MNKTKIPVLLNEKGEKIYLPIEEALPIKLIIVGNRNMGMSLLLHSTIDRLSAKGYKGFMLNDTRDMFYNCFETKK